MDANKIETLITDRTKVIIPVHYAGVSCDMNRIMSIANKYNLLVVEDAAQAIDSFYYERPLGSIGHMAAFSFHETKNVIAGEGGMLVINDERFIHRAEIIWEKGTNRAEFFRGEVNKYGWVDTGSSFLPSEIIAAFLYAQLENLDIIQKKRKELWDYYYQSLQCLIKEDIFELPNLPEYATNNAHMFYLICKDLEQRTTLIEQMKRNEILAVFHYQSLHSSEFYKNKHDGRELKNSDRFTDCLVRLPLYFELSKENIDFICNTIKSLHNTY